MSFLNPLSAAEGPKPCPARKSYVTAVIDSVLKSLKPWFAQHSEKNPTYLYELGEKTQSKLSVWCLVHRRHLFHPFSEHILGA